MNAEIRNILEFSESEYKNSSQMLYAIKDFRNLKRICEKIKLKSGTFNTKLVLHNIGKSKKFINTFQGICHYFHEVLGKKCLVLGSLEVLKEIYPSYEELKKNKVYGIKGHSLKSYELSSGLHFINISSCEDDLKSFDGFQEYSNFLHSIIEQFECSIAINNESLDTVSDNSLWRVLLHEFKSIAFVLKLNSITNKNLISNRKFFLKHNLSEVGVILDD